MSTKKEELIQRAKMAEQADRYDDMAQLMKEAIEQDKVVTAEERNLFSFAYKNMVGARRHSWRIISEMEKKFDTAEQKQWAKTYREKIEAEMSGICNDVLTTSDKSLIPNADAPDAKVFYLKMKADYLRYLAEIAGPNDRQAVVEKSRSAYAEAFDIAKDKMAPTNTIRLGLALNFSVFYYEIANSQEKACQLAKSAFDEALAALPSVDEDSHKDCTLIRDNLNLWTSDTDHDSSNEQAGK